MALIIKNSDALFEQINGFIDENFKISYDYETAKENLDILFDYLKSNNYVLNSDIVKDLLLKNCRFYNSLDYVVTKNFEDITGDNFEWAEGNRLLMFCGKIFCDFNDVDLNTLKKSDFYDASYNDTITYYIQDILKYPVLSKEESKVLFEKYTLGVENARNKLIEHNLRLVIYWAKKFIGCGVDFEDLIQEGNQGLMRAIEKYDLSKNILFGTYASWWIKQFIRRSIGNSARTIRIPFYMYEKVRKYFTVLKQLQMSLGRNPSNAELAKSLNITEAQVDEIKYYSEDAISLNTIVVANESNEENELVNYIKNEDAEFEDDLVDKLTYDTVEQRLINVGLSSRELNILLLRFGLNNQKPLTLIEISKIYHISSERVRQIINSSLAICRKSKAFRDLSGIYGSKPLSRTRKK